MIPPRQMYNFFIQCIKQFEYEEKIYDKFLTINDLKLIKSFVEKIDKYIMRIVSPSSGCLKIKEKNLKKNK